jgi:hypothetical protein
MSSKISGFRRPYSLTIIDSHKFACLTKSPVKEIILIDDNYDSIIRKTLNNLSIRDAESISYGGRKKKLLAILDRVNNSIYWLDLALNVVRIKKTHKINPRTMFYNEITNKLYVSFVDSPVVMQYCFDDPSDPSVLCQCPNINGFNQIDAMTSYGSVLYFIDTAASIIKSVDLEDKQKIFTQHLSFGRDGQGFIRQPTDINIFDNCIVVHDTDNYLIQIFDKDFNFKYQIGGKGDSNCKLDMAVSGDSYGDQYYICDENNDRILCYHKDRDAFDIVVESKFVLGQLRRPSGVVCDNGLIYVADRSNNIVQVFNSENEFVSLLKFKGKTMFFDNPASVSIDNVANNKYLSVIERCASNNGKLTIHSMLSPINLDESICIHPKIVLRDPQDMSSNTKGSLYIADTLNRRLIKVGIKSEILCEVDMVSVSGNDRILIKTVSVSDNGNVFTADFDNFVIYEFNCQLKIINKIDLTHLRESAVVLRAVFAFDEYILLCVRGDSQLISINRAGSVINKFNGFHETGIEFNHPVKISKLCRDGVLVVDKENDRVLKINNEFEFSN